VSSVDAVSVDAVLEARAECSDADRAQAVLADALTAARAPRRGREGRWTVTVRVSRLPKSLSAEAEIVDDRGTPVAQRTVTDKSAKCAPVARAIGAWATLVLDAELVRAKDDADRAEAAAAPPDPPVGAAAAPPPSGAPDGPFDGPYGDGSPPPTRTLELGMMMYLRNAVATTGGVGGLAPYVSVEVARSWMLRPGLLLGRSTTAVPVDDSGTTALFSQYGVRLDMCRRVPGNYIEHRGIELDLCAGLDASVLVPGELRQNPSASRPATAGTADRIAVGPSMILRGELGAGFALEIRGVGGINTITSGFGSEGDIPAFTASGELGVSWRLPP
jgi:hypothetical protein